MRYVGTERDTYVGSYLGNAVVFRLEKEELVMYPAAAGLRVVVDQDLIDRCTDDELVQLITRAIRHFSV